MSRTDRNGTSSITIAGLAVFLEDVVHADHVRMAEPRGHLRFSHRAAPDNVPLSIVHFRRPDNLLDRHIPVEQFVVRPPDGTHAAAADYGAKPVPVGEETLRLRG